jgi:hypothetical protein
MPGRRNLLDAPAENAAALHQVRNLGLVQRNLDRSGSNVVGGGIDVGKLDIHSVRPFFLWKREGRSTWARPPVWNIFYV